MNPTWYLVVREIQLWLCLIPTTLFLAAYLWYMRRKKYESGTWYILGWTITCEFAFVLSFLRRLFPDASWVRYVGIILGMLIVVMSWAMLFMLVRVYRKRYTALAVRRVPTPHADDSK